MLYNQRSFTLPASKQAISQRAWDYALMDREEFLEKYGKDAEEYNESLTKRNNLQ